MIRAVSLLLLLISSVISRAQNLEQEFQKVLDSLYKSTPESIGIMVHVEFPDNHLSWTSAVGVSNRETMNLLHKNQPVLIASNTKTFVAAAILKLVEERKLRLDESIQDFIKKEYQLAYKRNGYDLSSITLRHLLSHTSGINDYVTDEYFQFVNDNPSYNWTPDEQIKNSIKLGKPYANPGTAYKYGDINYVLLTHIIENTTQKPFYTSIRELLNYNKLGLRSTWFANLENTPETANSLAHQYSDKHNWDSYDLNPSWDLYGGGGLIANTKDLAVFIQNLFEGEIIKNQAILKEMYTYVLPKETSNYCLGIKRIALDNYTLFYHGGFWGTDVAYIPEIKTTIAVFSLQKNVRHTVNPFLSKKITNLIMGLKKENH